VCYRHRSITIRPVKTDYILFFVYFPFFSVYTYGCPKSYLMIYIYVIYLYYYCTVYATAHNITTSTTKLLYNILYILHTQQLLIVILYITIYKTPSSYIYIRVCDTLLAETLVNTCILAIPKITFDVWFMVYTLNVCKIKYSRLYRILSLILSINNKGNNRTISVVESVQVQYNSLSRLN